MIVKYQYLESEALLVQQFIGPFSMEDYARYARSVFPTFKNKNVSNIIIDFREIEFENDHQSIDLNIRKMSKYRRRMQRGAKRQKIDRRIFYVSKPLPTVIAQLFIEFFPDISYNYCSTAKSIKEILKIKDSTLDIDKYIENLENTFE